MLGSGLRGASRIWLAEFGTGWRWWTSELAHLLPTGLRRALSGYRCTVNIDVTETEIFVTRTNGYEYETLARILQDDLSTRTLAHAMPRPPRFGWMADPIVLRLPESVALQRELTLPATAMGDIDSILSYEVERLSPIESANICYDYRIARGSEKNLKVSVRIVRRDVVESALETCRAAGIEPSAVGFIGDDRFAAGGNFPILEDAARRIAIQRWSVPALAGAAAILLLCLSGSIYLRQQMASDDLAQRADDLHLRARIVENLRSEIALAEKRAVFLNNQKKVTPAIQVLAEISRVLPDGAWLGELETNGDEIRLHGFSNASAALIGQFDASPNFSDAQFRSPSTQGPLPGVDRFDLSFKVKHS